ncbi:MAG: Fe-S cluster assembly protein SufD [Acidobacteria bacterium]|nr:Fe-S cluster assembly protein SufD [Acidobacteriota bacterium]
MTQLAERHESLVAGFEALKRQPDFGRDGLAEARSQALDRFLVRGFPTTRDEEWRFTNVAPIAALRVTPAPARTVDAVTVAGLQPAGQVGVSLVVVNGRLTGHLPVLPAGVTVRTFASARQSELLPPRPVGGTVFTDLNTAYFEDVVVIDIAPKAIVTDPIQVLFVSVAGADPVLVTPRLVVRAGEASQASLIETYADATPGGVAWVNAVVDVHVEAGAFVDHVKVQRQNPVSFHLGGTFIRLDRSATFTSHAVTIGGRIARNDIVSVLDGEGAECTLNGLYVGNGDALIDTHTTIDHAKAHCPSHEVYKGILAGKAKAVFNGKILVRLDAQKTDAKQTNKALLLTDEAQINTKPQLEIFADDVKCTHGAAIGQLDEDALFYLKARGIGAIEARNMLIHAFAGDVLNGIRSESVRKTTMTLVEEMLGLPA